VLLPAVIDAADDLHVLLRHLRPSIPSGPRSNGNLDGILSSGRWLRSRLERPAPTGRRGEARVLGLRI
jgi:hypothetical protein